MTIHAYLPSPFFNVVLPNSNLTKFTKNNLFSSSFDFIAEKLKALWRDIYDYIDRVDSRIRGRILENPPERIPGITRAPQRRVTINALPQFSRGSSRRGSSSLTSSFCSDSAFSEAFSDDGSLHSLLASYPEYGLNRSGSSTPKRPPRPRSRVRGLLIGSAAFSK